jgi:hypothetical protein
MEINMAGIDMNGICKWTYNKEFDFWQTNCGHGFVVNDWIDPSECGFVYCPYCGKKIEE